jgi:Cysteine-rich secretory protein family
LLTVLRRRIASLVAATAVAVTAFAATSAQASTQESQFVSLTNSARSSAGLAGYSVASDLVSLARRHSQEMAAKHTIYHNPNLANDVSGWQMVGENVGMGGSVSSIHQAFMNSPAHKANILDHDFTQVGIGTAFDDKGVLYVTEVFRKPSGSTAPAPAPATTTAPKPAFHPVASSTTSYRPATKPATKPVARPVAKPDPRAALLSRLENARRLAGHNAASGAVARAVTYSKVMASLA